MYIGKNRSGGMSMIRAFYDATFVASVILMLAYVCMWHRHFDIHITLVFVLVPVVNLGYSLLGRAETLESAVLANAMSYIGPCYLLPVIMLSVFSLCHIPLPRWARAALLTAGTGIYICALTTGSHGLFYRSIAYEPVNGAMVLTKVYGPIHTLFYGMIIACFLASVGAMVYSYVRKKQVSRKLIYLLFFPVALCMLSFFGGRRITPQVELIPAAYVASMATYLVISRRMCLYDISESAVDSLVQTGDTGFISLDFRLNYLGSNGTAKAVFPELNDLTVDRPMAWSAKLQQTTLKWLADFQANEADCEAFYTQGERIYQAHVGYLYDGRRRRGYQLTITDDTADRQYINLLNRFNTELTDEVAEKTKHIVEMHDKLILGMATMVESRDNSTGGHIRRTSEGVRLLTEQIRAGGEFELTDDFCARLIKAAPMHDLGKIAVDDAILRKPGRFTPEEFEVMKSHAAEGARIVHEILDGVEDARFARIAENVAHYHHERWDGSGYPEGLKGEEIPLEARIMAIADVYDALVSKRVYKESMSFEQAHAIIMEGMGRHFDARLQPCYLRAKPSLEAYYEAVGR